MCGCHEVGFNSVKNLLENGFSLNYIVTITKEKAEQQNVSGYASFDLLALEYGIPIYYVEKYSMKSEADLAFFKRNNFDLLIQGGWQRLFPGEILKTLSVGAIGVHGSAEFLPKGRGRSPINWSLIEGKRRFILHFFLMKSGVDDGDVFHYETFDINDWDTCKTLYYKNSILTKNILLSFIPKLLDNDYTIIPQVGVPTYYKKRTPEDGIIDWTNTVFVIHNFVRALTKPYPGAFSFVNNEKILFWKVQPFDTRITYPNALEGEIVEIFDSTDFIVQCNSGLLLVTEYSCKISIQVGQIFTNKNE
ncbi:methionyl-tRNA formyltransferase [Mesoflavibacter zeaxanthinifaciens]|uniref:methionyl-tRNA formyltransferase n=1 Tax=Mesoflavibacter zeaxanthinifaciens TaxID=393060 RepID=UPI003A93ED56